MSLVELLQAANRREAVLLEEIAILRTSNETLTMRLGATATAHRDLVEKTAQSPDPSLLPIPTQVHDVTHTEALVNKIFKPLAVRYGKLTSYKKLRVIVKFGTFIDREYGVTFYTQSCGRTFGFLCSVYIGTPDETVESYNVCGFTCGECSVAAEPAFLFALVDSTRVNLCEHLKQMHYV